MANLLLCLVFLTSCSLWTHYVVLTSQGHTVQLTSGNSCVCNSVSRSIDAGKALSNSSELFIRSMKKCTKADCLDEIGLERILIVEVTKAIGVILNRQEWKGYIVIASTHEDLTAISNSLQIRALILLTSNADAHLKSVLSDIYTALEEQDLNFIVVCSWPCITKLLHQAILLEYKKKKFARWLVVPTGKCATELLPESFQIKTTDVVILDVLVCSNTFHVPISNPNKSTVQANVYVFQKTFSETALVKAGYIDQNQRIVLVKELFPTSKYGLENKTLTVTLLEWKPFVYRQEVNGNVSYSGICLDLLKELAHSLNFRFVEPEDQEFGRIRDGNWTGMIDLLIKQKVDLLLGPIAVDASREKVVDFTLPYFFDSSAILLKKMDIDSTKWMTLISPFRFEVYVGIAISFIFSSLLLFVVEEVNPINAWENNRPIHRWKRLGDIVWYHLGGLMANGGGYATSNSSGRSILSCWWLFTVMSAAIYSGNLIAFLTDWREKMPFSTMADMLEQETYHWGTLGGSNYENLFKISNRTEYKKIWHGMMTDVTADPDVLSTDMEVHLRKLLSGRYAYISDLTNLKMWENQYCDLHLLREVFSVIYLAIGLQNNSIYTNLFSKHILRISESGLINVWYEHWMPRSHCETTRSAKRVELLALQSAFYAAAVGVVLALSALLIEVLYNRKCFVQSPTQKSNTNIETL